MLKEKQLIEILNQIINTNSKKEKIEIISKQKGNILFEGTLKFLLDGSVITGISKKKLSKNVPCLKGTLISEWSNMMEYLSQMNTGRDCDVAIVQAFLNNFNNEDKNIMSALCSKSLKLGCDVKSVNKAIPNLIPQWEVQQAYSIDKYKLKKCEWFALSEKLNGNRGSYLNGVIKSRQNKIFTGLDHIVNDLKVLGLEDKFVDGELRRKNTDNLSDGENFRVGTGILNSDEDKSEIEFIIFDVMSKEEFLKGESEYPYSVRMSELERLRDRIEDEYEDEQIQNVKVVEIYFYGSSESPEEVIDHWLEKAISEDKEGLMLNRDVSYRCKRHNGILKVKRFYTMDLEIVDVEEGDGRLNGTLGALVVKYKGNTVNVGSGFDDVMRSKLWNDQDNIIGKIVEVRYKEITKDKKTGLESLQFPTFVKMREDKNRVSYD